MIEFLGGLGVDAAVIVGLGLAVVVALRFGGALTRAVRMGRAMRERFGRIRPVIGAALVLGYILFVVTWFLRGSPVGPFAVLVLAGLIAAASWAAVRDVLEGAYVRAARTLAEGDRVRVGAIRGRIQKMGYRHVFIEGSDGELAIVPYRVLSSETLLRTSDHERTSFHVFRVGLPADMEVTSAKRLVRETALLSHWSSIARTPQVVATGTAELEVTVFAIDADRAPEIEAVVRRALAATQPP